MDNVHPSVREIAVLQEATEMILSSVDVDTVLHGGQFEREVERRPRAQGHDWRVERGQFQDAARIAVAQPLRDSVHAATAAADNV